MTKPIPISGSARHGLQTRAPLASCSTGLQPVPAPARRPRCAHPLVLAPLLGSLVTLCGCHATPQPSSADYQTVGSYPRRDTDAARRENETALVLMARKDWPAAEQALRRALAQDVMFGPAHNNLGLVYYHQNQLYLAAWEFQYAIKLMPNQPEARNNLGLVFESGGRLDQAVESYEQAVKLEPDNPQFVGNDARARVRRGDNDSQVRQLLDRLVSLDSRPDWLNWARERLAVMKRPTTDVTR